MSMPDHCKNSKIVSLAFGHGKDPTEAVQDDFQPDRARNSLKQLLQRAPCLVQAISCGR
jgi:hypothetical protein